LHCKRRFTTYEKPEETFRLSVIKKDGSREPYDRQKIIRGLQHASYKRPVTDEQILRVVDSVEEDIFAHYDREVPSSFIGDSAGVHLRNVDKIAYVRFASVYREFRDVGELIQEAQEVKDAATPGTTQRPLFEP